MLNWLKQLFCGHDWRDEGHTDYCSVLQAVHYDDGTRRRVYYWTCRKCGKRSKSEQMVVTR